MPLRILTGGRAKPRRRSEPRKLRLLISGGEPKHAWTDLRVDWLRVALWLCTVCVLSALISLHLIPDRVRLQEGDISIVDVRAPRTVTFVDQEVTRQLRVQAGQRIAPVYSPVTYAAPEANTTATGVFDAIRAERNERAPSVSRLDGALRKHVGFFLSDPAILKPLLTDSSGFHVDQAERVVRSVLDTVMQREIRSDKPDDLVQARETASVQISASMLPRDLVPASVAIARALVRPNRIYDAERTMAARESEQRRVSPQNTTVFAGDIVIRRGDLVSAIAIEKLHALGLQNPRIQPLVVAAVTIFVILMVGIVCIHLARYHAHVYRSTKMLLLLSLLATFSVLGLKIDDTMLGVRLSGALFGYVGMLWVAAAGMLISALINPRVAMLVTSLMAAQSGILLGNDVRFPLMTLLSTLFAIYAVADIRSRNDVVRAALMLSLVNVALALIVGRIEGDAWTDIRQAMLWAGAGGTIAVALFSLGAAVFEKPFGITTHLGLLELSDPNRPLLQRFCQIAPGTYTHSVMVGNLAVAAAEAIGADALLCRVGALYHDLGKMRRAEFFVENQCNGDNAHEKLNPSLSALIITAHVKDGLEIAEQEHLPPVIKAFITEHHGTSLIRYFYHQQVETEGEDVPHGLEQHFRYAGPKPQSRETAILMLADGVEAASRALRKPTLNSIEALVDKIIGAQLADGQLDECDITLKDLRGIRGAFVRLLGGMLHNRIEYPETGKQPTLKLDHAHPKIVKNGSTDQSNDGVVPQAPAEEETGIGDHDTAAA